jgi:hypothetical protein
MVHDYSCRMHGLCTTCADSVRVQKGPCPVCRAPLTWKNVAKMYGLEFPFTVCVSFRNRQVLYTMNIRNSPSAVVRFSRKGFAYVKDDVQSEFEKFFDMFRSPHVQCRVLDGKVLTLDMYVPVSDVIIDDVDRVTNHV